MYFSYYEEGGIHFRNRMRESHSTVHEYFRESVAEAVNHSAMINTLYIAISSTKIVSAILAISSSKKCENKQMYVFLISMMTHEIMYWVYKFTLCKRVILEEVPLEEDGENQAGNFSSRVGMGAFSVIFRNNEGFALNNRARRDSYFAKLISVIATIIYGFTVSFGIIVYLTLPDLNECRNTPVQELFICFLSMAIVYMILPELLVFLSFYFLPTAMAFFNCLCRRGQQITVASDQSQNHDWIGNIDVVPYRKSQKAISEGCCICLNNYQEGDSIIYLPCNREHHFHSECVRKWLECKESCPLCREKIKEFYLNMGSPSQDQL